MIKIALVSSAESTHTIRWANALSKLGLQVFLISQHELKGVLVDDVKFLKLKFSGSGGYFMNVPQFKKIIRKIEPDVIHAHYASGYGTLLANSGFNFILSVWGSDVYDFPNQSIVKKYLLKRALAKADKLYSTSHCMKLETLKYTNKHIDVIPFGVDVDLYFDRQKDGDFFRIGIVKVLADKYGVDILIRAFSIVVSKVKSPLQLVIAGDGPDYKKLKNLGDELGIANLIHFLGWVDNHQVPDLLKTFDVFVVPSRLDSESFGVAAVEAGAARLPCIVSNVGGLPEVVVDGLTGLVVPKESPEELATALIYLIENNSLCEKFGNNGYERVKTEYSWWANVNAMKNQYLEYK